MRQAFAITVAAAALLGGTASNVSATTSEPTGLTPSETHWITKLVPMISGLATFSSAVSRLSANPAVLVKGSHAQVQLVIALAGLSECTPTLNQTGSAPTLRLRPFRAALASACGHYGRTATLLARGIDVRDAVLIRAAAAEMQRGTSSISRANRLILAFQ